MNFVGAAAKLYISTSPNESVVSQRFILKDRIWASRSKKSYLIILF